MSLPVPSSTATLLQGYHEPRCELADNHHPQVSEILNFNDSSYKSTKSDTNTLQQAAFSQPSMDVFLMTFWYMTEADLTAFRSAIDAFESHHY